jgi:hypothetical protein
MKNQETIKRNVYQYNVLMMGNNIPRNKYDNAIEAYEEKIDELNEIIRSERLENKPNHFIHQQITWMTNNRAELERRIYQETEELELV